MTVLLVASLVAAYMVIWAAYGFRYNAIPDGVGGLPMSQVLGADAPPLLKTLAGFAAENLLFPEAWLYGQLYTITNIHRAPTCSGYLPRRLWALFSGGVAGENPCADADFGRPSARRIFSSAAAQKNSMAGAVDTHRRLSRHRDELAHEYRPAPHPANRSLPMRCRRCNSHTPLAKRRGLEKSRNFVVGCWSLWNVFAVHPHYLAYFNELAGGAANGHKVLIDSNLDWGQDLKALKRWMDGQGVRKIWLLYFGTAEPAYYGIDAVRVPGAVLPPRLHLPPTHEVPTKLAISANYFYGAEIYATPREKEFSKPQNSPSRSPPSAIRF